jgi:ATP-dependent Clp protease ATP-binding subunit ClpB
MQFRQQGKELTASSSLEVGSARQLIARKGFDPQFGARPIKRTIQDRLLDPLATKLLLGEFKPGDRIKVVVRDGELEFAKK